MITHYSPLRYPGGKSSIFKFISSLISENHLIGIEYAEPYAGGAGLALRLLVEGFVRKIYINDLDNAVYSFWKTIIEETNKFCAWIDTLEINLDVWNHYRNVYMNQEKHSAFNLAQATFFLNRTNVSGVIKGGVIGGLKQTGPYKIGARFNKQELIERIRTVGQYSNNIVISNYDGLDFIKIFKRMKKEVLLYLDPPYVNKAAKLYMNYFSIEDHKLLAKQISKMKNRYIVSYDRNELIFCLYHKQNKFVYDIQQSTSNKTGSEVLIFSDNLSINNSISHITNPVLI